ncbi:MAG TPA: ABC transporter permease, partial [Chitinophagaceae bacterium]|nr:ABC transporter permease [Chitinophagaceae bacterium]
MPASNPNRNAWRRLRRNKGALAGLIVIAASLLVAAGCYLMAPDKTPNANRMVVEISGRKPGYTQQFLKIPRERKIEGVSLFTQIISGREDKYQFMPISGYEMKGDSVIVQRYIDEGVSERLSYSRAQLQMNAGNNQPIETIKFRLGTDKYGRDILSRLLVGVRVSLAVGLVTVLISLSIGVLLGALAGYYRGRVDNVVMWFINIIWSIPTLLLVFAITLVLGKGFWQVFIAIGLTLWVNVARIIRGQILSIRELEYVEAARALGFAGPRIIVRHILPNVMGPVLVVAASNFATAIVIEAGLSFLGVGVQPPQPSWGLMIKEN